ncbi:MAG: hypothetical protein D6730_22755, partial [Bacteroidetes bacterium]
VTILLRNKDILLKEKVNNIESNSQDEKFTLKVNAYLTQNDTGGHFSEMLVTLLKKDEETNSFSSVESQISPMIRGTEVLTFKELLTGTYRLLVEATEAGQLYLGISEEKEINSDQIITIPEPLAVKATRSLNMTLEQKIRMAEQAVRSSRRNQQQPPPPKSGPSPGFDIPKAEEKTAADLQATLKARQVQYKRLLFSLNKNQTFKGNKTYERAQEFVNQGWRSFDALNKAFEPLLKTLIDRSAKGSKRQANKGLLEIVVQHYLDQVVALQPDTLSDTVAESIKEVGSKIKEKRLGLSRIRSNWNSAALIEAGGLSAGRIEQLLK